METLDLERFSPKEAELAALAEEGKHIVINGVDDKAGYELAQKVRIKLKNARVEIQKTGKLLRADALAFQKAVIEREKELIAIVDPVETELEQKQQVIDDEKERMKRVELLPHRRERLAEISLVVEDEVLLGMDGVQFESFMNEKRAEFLAAKEREMREESERIEAEKRKMQEEKDAEEARKQREADIEKARKEGEAEAKRKAKQKELEQEERVRKEKAEAEESARREAEELEKNKRFQKFLKDNGYSETQKSEFFISKEVGKVVLFKKVAELSL